MVNKCSLTLVATEGPQMVNKALSFCQGVFCGVMSCMLRCIDLWHHAVVIPPFAGSSLNDQVATDNFVTEMVIQLSRVLVLVTDAMRSSEIEQFFALYEQVKKFSTPTDSRTLIVVHNWKNYFQLTEVEKHIQVCSHFQKVTEKTWVSVHMSRLDAFFLFLVFGGSC